MRDTTSIRRRPLLALALLWSPAPFAVAQSTGRIVRLGVLTPDPRDPDTSTWKTFASELARLGWTEGRNLRVERRLVDTGRLDVLDRMAHGSRVSRKLTSIAYIESADRKESALAAAPAAADPRPRRRWASASGSPMSPRSSGWRLPCNASCKAAWTAS